MRARVCVCLSLSACMCGHTHACMTCMHACIQHAYMHTLPFLKRILVPWSQCLVSNRSRLRCGGHHSVRNLSSRSGSICWMKKTFSWPISSNSLYRFPCSCGGNVRARHISPSVASLASGNARACQTYLAGRRVRVRACALANQILDLVRMQMELGRGDVRVGRVDELRMGRRERRAGKSERRRRRRKKGRRSPPVRRSVPRSWT